MKGPGGSTMCPSPNVHMIAPTVTTAKSIVRTTFVTSKP